MNPASNQPGPANQFDPQDYLPPAQPQDNSRPFWEELEELPPSAPITEPAQPATQAPPSTPEPYNSQTTWPQSVPSPGYAAPTQTFSHPLPQPVQTPRPQTPHWAAQHTPPVSQTAHTPQAQPLMQPHHQNQPHTPAHFPDRYSYSHYQQPAGQLYAAPAQHPGTSQQLPQPVYGMPQTPHTDQAPAGAMGFSHRINVPTFLLLWFVIAPAVSIGGFILAIIVLLVNGLVFRGEFGNPVERLISLTMLAASLCVVFYTLFIMARAALLRLWDAGLGQAYLLLLLIPFAGLITLILCIVKPTQQHPNKHGDPPTGITLGKPFHRLKKPRTA